MKQPAPRYVLLASIAICLAVYLIANAGGSFIFVDEFQKLDKEDQDKVIGGALFVGLMVMFFAYICVDEWLMSGKQRPRRER